MLFAIHFMSLCFDRYIDYFENTCIGQITWVKVVTFTFNTSLIGTVFLALFSFTVLHCWMNAIAEILKFADRGFYQVCKFCIIFVNVYIRIKCPPFHCIEPLCQRDVIISIFFSQDWWNSTSFLVYHRLWNNIVQDWFFTYVYNDICLLTSKNKNLAGSLVLFISAVAHEYALFYSLGFFAPFCFFLFFIPTLIFFLLKTQQSNLYFLYNIGLGFNILIVGYTWAYYAEQNCPRESHDFWDILTPAIIRCKCYQTIHFITIYFDSITIFISMFIQIYSFLFVL